MNSQEARTPAAAHRTERRLLMIEQGGQGGIADYTSQLTRELGAQGWQVELATAADHRYGPAPGVTVHRVFHYLRGHTLLSRGLRRYRLGWIVNGVRFLITLPRLTRLARRVDLVHVQSWETPALGLIAIAGMRLAGATIVQTEHNTFERGGRLIRTRTALHRALARLTARTIVHTQADLAGASPRRRSRVAVIPHGEYGSLARTGGVADRAAARAALGIAPDAPVTLVFGQLRTDKGFGDLLEALGHVPSLHLLVGGKDLGALAAARAQLQSPELRGRVTVREGFLEMSEAARLFAAADTVALPYKVASQSGVLLLAYGFRRPPIVYPVGGLTESVLDGETGWICARADSAALVDALAASVAAGWPECRRRGEAGAAFAQERFAWPAIARRTGALYDEALAEKAGLRLRQS
jgi:glycosyltransferase involved in cell wall biosynthesis